MAPLESSPDVNPCREVVLYVPPKTIIPRLLASSLDLGPVQAFLSNFWVRLHIQLELVDTGIQKPQAVIRLARKLRSDIDRYFRKKKYQYPGLAICSYDISCSCYCPNMTHGEEIERMWAAANPMELQTHQMRPGEPHDCLEGATYYKAKL
ncbi:hypothetical protein C8R43DRAFT_1130298 [Mycena crocata]|nr:hypothetical protein C8R43DRAFT_1130298 [Mycena crocata]